MRLPIQYALFHPVRLPNDMIPRFDTGIPYSLTFQPLEPERYPCFNLAVDAAQKGGTFPAVLSAADEVAVNAFLEGRIGFTDIYSVVEKVLGQHHPSSGQDAGEVLEADRWATAHAREITGQ